MMDTFNNHIYTILTQHIKNSKVTILKKHFLMSQNVGVVEL